MSVFSFSFLDAQANYASRNRFSRWFSQHEENPNHATARMQGEVFLPGVNVSRRLRMDDSIFTIGSCFARNVERALDQRGFRVLSLVRGKELGVGDEKAIGFVNRYNTSSILREMQWASGERVFPEQAFCHVGDNLYVDLHSHPTGGAKPLPVMKEIRRQLTEYFAQALSASTVTVTLGLIECWYDKLLDDCINFTPAFGSAAKKRPLLSDTDRYEFRVLSFQENMQNLEELFALLKRHNPSCHIIVTVSPVALMATFTHRDVVVANCLSKSMLRTCAETWQGNHPGEIDYFPSYEMATMSRRRRVYRKDGVHVRGEFVDKIMAHFEDAFIEDRRPALAAAE